MSFMPKWFKRFCNKFSKLTDSDRTALECAKEKRARKLSKGISYLNPPREDVRTCPNECNIHKLKLYSTIEPVQGIIIPNIKCEACGFSGENEPLFIASDAIGRWNAAVRKELNNDHSI